MLKQNKTLRITGNHLLFFI